MSCHLAPRTIDYSLHLSLHSVLCVQKSGECCSSIAVCTLAVNIQHKLVFQQKQLRAIFDSSPIIFDNLQTSELCNSQKMVCKIWMVDVVYFYRKTIIIISGVIFYEYYVGLKISILLSATFSGPPLLQLVSVCSINRSSKNIHQIFVTIPRTIIIGFQDI